MWVDRESELDLLSYEPFAELVKDILLDETMNPLTIGLFGSWGAGKSTLLELINHKLDDENIPSDKKIAKVMLNAWAFEGYDDAKSAVMESLLLELKEDTPEFAQMKDGLRDLIKKVNFFRMGKFALKYGVPAVLSSMSPLGLAGGAAYLGAHKSDIIDDAKGIIKDEVNKAIEGLTNSEDMEQDVISNIRVFKKEFEKLIVNSGITNLVVMIDDLDRCSPERIIETLEAIKLFLAVPKTTFIIAIDDAVIKYSVKKTYPKIEDDDFGIVDNYIEKIIQLPIYIPELSENDMVNYLLLLVVQLYFKDDIVKELSEKLTSKNVFFNGSTLNESTLQEYVPRVVNIGSSKKGNYEEFAKMFKIISKVAKVISVELKGNPRQAKRFLHTFLVRKKLGEIYDKDKSKDLDYEILAQLTALEYMDKSLFRELYKASIKPSNSGKIDELSLLLQLANSTENFPEQLREWDKPKIKNWLKNSNLNDKGGNELLKYFYLSRESLHINYSAIDDLTLAERKLFNNIIQADRGMVIKTLIGKLRGQADINVNSIINAIIESFIEDYKLIDKCLYIYMDYEEFRGKIVEAILNMKLNDIDPKKLNTLNSIYKIDKNKFAHAIEHFKKIGMPKEQLDVITKEK